MTKLKLPMRLPLRVAIQVWYEVVILSRSATATAPDDSGVFSQAHDSYRPTRGSAQRRGRKLGGIRLKSPMDQPGGDVTRAHMIVPHLVIPHPRRKDEGWVLPEFYNSYGNIIGELESLSRP